MTDAVTTTIEVAVDPATAFAIFTEEIDRWWRPGAINWNHSDRAVGIRIEPGVGGRWLELEADSEDGFECGRITAWEPGERFVLEYRDAGHTIDGTEVEVRFDPVADGTRVTLEHRGWEAVAAEVRAARRNGKRAGWANILLWYSDWAFWGSPRRLARVTVDSVTAAD